MLKVGTLFSGIGAPEVALKSIGVKHKVIFACDNDERAKQTYLLNHQCDHFYNDIAEVPKHNIDLLVFGFPCQSFSFAGHKNGLNDVRGKLVFEAIKILKKCKPPYFIAENVAGLVKDKKTLNIILNSMKVAGYKVDYQILDSINFECPQNRKRVWFIGIRDDIKQLFTFPTGNSKKVYLKDYLNKKVDKKYFATEQLLSKPKVRIRMENATGNSINCITHTISRNGSSGEYISYVAAVNNAIGQARKPTPEECLRLFGFPKQFKFPKEVPTTGRYHQVGNTMVINVLCKIFKEMKINGFKTKK